VHGLVSRAGLAQYVAEGHVWTGLLGFAFASFAVAWAWIWHDLARLRDGDTTREWRPFFGTMAIFALSFLGLAYSLFPYLVIEKITIWDAAAHRSALVVILAGALVVLPFIVGYTVVAYRIFRGKAKAGLYD